MCGMLLIRAKGLLAHGEWIPWLKTNCKIPERTAREYMKLARSSEEYKGAKPSPRKATSKKLTLLPGMIVSVTRENSPGFGQSVEVVKVEGEMVTCKTYEGASKIYFISELIPPKIKRTSEPRTKPKPEPNLLEIHKFELAFEKARIELLEGLLKQFLSAAQKNHLPSQRLLKEAEYELSWGKICNFKDSLNFRKN